MDCIKKVSLIGMGGVGSMFAERLSRLPGVDFRVIAGGQRKKRFDEDFFINGEPFRFNIIDPSDTGDPADLVLVTVKGYALEQAMEDIQNQVGPDTLILNFLNGVECEEKLIAKYGEERVLYGYIYIAAALKDGKASYIASKVNARFGDEFNSQEAYSPRVKRVKELFDRAQIPYRIEADMRLGIWRKFLANIGENMPIAMLDLTYSSIRSEHFRWISRAGQEEVVAIARAKGIELRLEDIDRRMENAEKTYDNIASWKPSTAMDLEDGKTTEVDMFSGAVVRMGRELGVPTPCNELYYHSIKVLEEKNSGLFD